MTTESQQRDMAKNSYSNAHQCSDNSFINMSIYYPTSLCTQVLLARPPYRRNNNYSCMHAGFGVKTTGLLPFGAFLVGLGGLCFHLSQFHTAQLFPSNKGFVSSLYVGFFIASGVSFEVVRAIYASLSPADGPAYGTYLAILICHACLCLPWAGVMLWMNPRRSLKAGQTYHLDTSTFRFVVSHQESAEPTHGLTLPLSSDSSRSPVNTGGSSSEDMKERSDGVCEHVNRGSCASTRPPSDASPDLQTPHDPGSKPGIANIEVQSSCGRSCGHTGQRVTSLPGHNRAVKAAQANDDTSCQPSSCNYLQPHRQGYQLRRRCSLTSKSARCDDASHGMQAT